MNLDERRQRDEICRWGESLFRRGLTAGSSGNLSARVEDGMLVTPTGVHLGGLEPRNLTLIDDQGQRISGEAPTKEVPFHAAFYAARPKAGGIVHLHSVYGTAISCLKDVDPCSAISPVTPYSVIRLGDVPVIPYTRPGDKEAGKTIWEYAKTHAAVLLGNHGPVVSANDLESAVYAAEELEATARLMLVLHGRDYRTLSEQEVRELRQAFSG